MNPAKTYTYQYSSSLVGVSPQQVWDRISSWEGVNYELGPLVKMSVPSVYAQLIDIPADGECHFTSKIFPTCMNAPITFF